MALAAVKTFVAAEVLFAADLNTLNTNILTNALALVSPWTANMAAGGFRLTGLALGTVGDPALQFTGDPNTGIYSTAADTVDVATGGSRAASFGASSLIAAAPEDARTNTVDVVHEFRSTTSGVPAANIGVGVLYSAESADENPSDFGRLDFVATDITAASEDTVLDVLLRTAGAALGARYRFQATGAFRALFTCALTADRTFTFPDSDTTISQIATQAEMEAASSNTVAVSPGRTQYHPGVAKARGQWNDACTLAANSYNITSITDTGVGDHTANLTTAMSGTTGSIFFAPGVASRVFVVSWSSSSAARIEVFNLSAAAADSTTWHFAADGDQ